MTVEIKTVNTKQLLKTFAKFPFGLYKGNEFWIPPLIADEMETFNEAKNPAYETAETRLFLAYKNGQPVGRIAAILSHAANNKYSAKNMRFGWFDAIDDTDVSTALFGAVEGWAKEKGMETLTGPHGFTDLDPEGMLIEGYDQMPTISVYYNYPYYNTLVEHYGFEKEIDYFEFRSVAPHDTGIPPKLLRLAERITERSGVTLLNFKNRKEMMSRAPEIFTLLDETFEEIYGSVPITEKQINYYVQKYISFADPTFIKAVVNQEDEMVGFMIALPSLSEGFKKANGRLLPFGWYHILRSMKKCTVLDFYLAGIKPSYRGQGIDLMMVMEILKAAMEKGILYSESNPELETNKKIHAQWKYFNPTLHKKRRIYRKEIG